MANQRIRYAIAIVMVVTSTITTVAWPLKILKLQLSHKQTQSNKDNSFESMSKVQLSFRNEFYSCLFEYFANYRFWEENHENGMTVKNVRMLFVLNVPEWLWLSSQGHLSILQKIKQQYWDGMSKIKPAKLRRQSEIASLKKKSSGFCSDFEQMASQLYCEWVWNDQGTTLLPENIRTELKDGNTTLL